MGSKLSDSRAIEVDQPSRSRAVTCLTLVPEISVPLSEGIRRRFMSLLVVCKLTSLQLTQDKMT